MISGSLVLVLGDIPAQPGKFSGLAFVIALSLELVLLVALPQQQQVFFAFDGLLVRQHVFTVLGRMAFLDFGRGLGLWGFGVAMPL